MVSAIASRSTSLSTGRRRRCRSTRCGGVGPSNGQSHAVAMMTSTRSAAVVGDRDDLGDLRGGLRGGASDVGAAVPVGGRHHVLDASAGRPRSRAWRRWGWRPGRRTRCRDSSRSSAASSAASASAGTFDGETNAVASISRTPVAATAASSSSLAANGIGSSICRPSRSETSRMSTCVGSSLICTPSPQRRRARPRSCRAGRWYTSSLCWPGRAEPALRMVPGRLREHRHHTGSQHVSADPLVEVLGDHAAGTQLRILARPRRPC